MIQLFTTLALVGLLALGLTLGLGLTVAALYVIFSACSVRFRWVALRDRFARPRWRNGRDRFARLWWGNVRDPSAGFSMRAARDQLVGFFGKHELAVTIWLMLAVLTGVPGLGFLLLNGTVESKYPDLWVGLHLTPSACKSNANGKPRSCKVKSVVAANNLVVECDGALQVERLQCIDVMPTTTKLGADTNAVLNSLTKDVTLACGPDTCSVSESKGQEDLRDLLLRAGLAQTSAHAPDELVKAQEVAKTARVGIWWDPPPAGNDPIRWRIVRDSKIENAENSQLQRVAAFGGFVSATCTALIGFGFVFSKFRELHKAQALRSKLRDIEMGWEQDFKDLKIKMDLSRQDPSIMAWCSNILQSLEADIKDYDGKYGQYESGSQEEIEAVGEAAGRTETLRSLMYKLINQIRQFNTDASVAACMRLTADEIDSEFKKIRRTTRGRSHAHSYSSGG